MQEFLAGHQKQIVGTLTCVDRLIIKGYLQPIMTGEGMESLMRRHRLLNKDYKQFVTRCSEEVKEHARKFAEGHGRRYQSFSGTRTDESKEQMVSRIIDEEGIQSGLVCVLAFPETCGTFSLIYGKGKPRIVSKRGSCLWLYFYFLHPVFGRIYVRLQTWFPFTVQVYINGHSWLAKRLSAKGVVAQSADNCFTTISDFAEAQRLANEFVNIAWPAVLNRLTRHLNPLLNTVLKGLYHYWVINQAEVSTDVIFAKPDHIATLFPQMLKYGITTLRAEDIFTFLGRKLTGAFRGDILGHTTRRFPGARIKHWVSGNWIKMYYKAHRVLRVETVINDPHVFKVYRTLKGGRGKKLAPLVKGVCNLRLYLKVASAANSRYLDAYAPVLDPWPAQNNLCSIAKPVHQQHVCYRGFNPLDMHTISLFAAVTQGKFTLQGFSNRNISSLLYPHAYQENRSKTRARTWRSLRRLRAHGFIYKIQSRRLWRVTTRGYALMGTSLALYERYYPELYYEKTAA